MDKNSKLLIHHSRYEMTSSSPQIFILLTPWWMYQAEEGQGAIPHVLDMLLRSRRDVNRHARTHLRRLALDRHPAPSFEDEVDLRGGLETVGLRGLAGLGAGPGRARFLRVWDSVVGKANSPMCHLR